jgi:hypothetical protein
MLPKTHVIDPWHQAQGARQKVESWPLKCFSLRLMPWALSRWFLGSVLAVSTENDNRKMEMPFLHPKLLKL